MHHMKQQLSNALHLWEVGGAGDAITCRGRQEQRVMHHTRETADINIK